MAGAKRLSEQAQSASISAGSSNTFTFSFDRGAYLIKRLRIAGLASMDNPELVTVQINAEQEAFFSNKAVPLTVLGIPSSPNEGVIGSTPNQNRGHYVIPFDEPIKADSGMPVDVIITNGDGATLTFWVVLNGVFVPRRRGA